MFTSQEDPLRLAYMVASIMNLEAAREQALLEAPTRVEALRHGARLAVARSGSAGAAQQDHRGSARRDVERAARIHPAAAEARHRAGAGREESAIRPKSEQLREKLAKADLPEDVRKEAERELGRLEKLPSAQPEYNVIRTWLEYVIELPWNKRSEDNLDIARARQVLDEDHFGITKVKERILEQLAVLKLNPEAKAPILCFVGAPGVGKTSLGQSIARALGRKFERMSLGGLHDEAELRGHRRTYIGALPGRLDSGHAAGGCVESGADAGRSGQAGARFPRRSGGGAAGSAGSGAEQGVPRQLSGSAVRSCRRCCSSLRRIRWIRFRRRCWTAWRSCGCRAIAKKRRRRSRGAICCRGS